MDLNKIYRTAKRRIPGLLSGTIPFLLILFVAATAQADLPGGEKVMQESIKALGGEKALARHHNCMMKGKMAMSGIEMTAITYSAEPDLSYTRFESPMVGKFESGCNGDVAWDLSVMQGASVKEGKELEEGLFDAIFNPELHWRDRYTDIEVQAEEEVEGIACYKVLITPVVGDVATVYYDKKTWLTMRIEKVTNSPNGSISVVNSLSDYRMVDGVNVPFKMKMVMMGAQEMTVTYESVEFNVEIPEGTFDLPAEIRELLADEQTQEEN
ncbi:MAG: hypothetical protein KOO63_14285 [Bacteroidales bacterium]|nr:hypothetical protein [Candidatus Latescibacterota bacterium]